MVNIRVWFVAAILSTVVFELSLAQTPSISPTTTSAPSLSVSPNSLDHVVELTGQLDQRLLTTVYWCLGTLVTVFLILIGYNWFVNFRVHERDFRELKNDISTGLEVAVHKIEAAAKVAGEELKTQVKKSAESHIDSKMAAVKSAIDSLDTELGKLQAQNLAQEVDMWLGKKVYRNVLRTHLAYLRKIQTVGYDWQLQKGLDKMETVLKTMMRETPGERPDADDIADWSRFLDTVAKQNPVIVKRLQSLLAQLGE